MKLLTHPFRAPTLRALIAEELEDAERQLLAAQTAKEYATAMVSYHQARIDRLTQRKHDGL